MNKQDKNNQIIIYNTEDGETEIEEGVKDEPRKISIRKKEKIKFL